MKLSRTVAYALQATMQLAVSDSDTPVPCSQIASKGEMPERFLLQVLRSLVNHGVLRSTRGVDGGYMLIRSPEEISLLDVIEAIDGPLDSKLPVTAAPDDVTQVNLQKALQDVTATARQQLESIKISQLITPPTMEVAAEESSSSETHFAAPQHQPVVRPPAHAATRTQSV
ncbi:RrF2 family transcriptional regulator [Blastopirellula marina]|uniref:Rrf2 family transcriptional regulator n=1 Tax=Blastopirellula marina TaxID=124 RepID=A0A2S8GTU3_9BACT|nr:Rrf2 family transcriptional regulator [Blastopirellula marina]PQO47832.1 Rrf2 family transcriptional regulator [Blastopirellula marina]